MIALRNLEESYSHGVSKTFVLRQIDIDVKEGEFLSIIQVTHSEAKAACGRRVIQLRDGWVVKE
ncbi:MAG: hypothetical protein VX427_06295 [Acidobacteriota bacterium]|nr:hypothetical protein [Acidobacteriota bacterium]